MLIQLKFDQKSNLIIMDFNFKDEEQVYQQVDKIFNKILSDKSFTNPQKLSLLIGQYEKKQERLDNQLSKSIKSQIQCINQSRQSVSEANNWMKQATQKSQTIKGIWSQQIEFHQFMEDVFTLNIFTTNIGKVIQQLTYFIDMESQMHKLQKLAEDSSKYLYVNSKLMNLIELRNALLEDVSFQRQTAIMRKQFVKVDNFQISFYDRIFQGFNDLYKFAKEHPDALINSVKVIEAYDHALQKKGKQRVMRDRAIQIIRQSVDMKFIEKLSDQDDLIGIIQNSKFAMTDLVQIGDIVAPCFPKQFEIMEIFQKQYQQNIQKQIIPFFDQIEEQNQYGNLVVLLGWIDDYETMLTRAGLDSTYLVALKSKVKIMMPFFLQHNRKIVEDYIENCLVMDEKNYNRKFYEQVLRDGSDLVSLFPSDIFRFINQEAQIIKDQLKGQIFVQFVRCITQALNMFQKDLAKNVLEELQTIRMIDNDDKIVDYQYKLIMFINNYHQCLKHASQSKQLFTQLVSEQYKVRIEKIFMTQVQKEFNTSIPMFIHGVIQIIFMKVISETYPALFTMQWQSDNSRQLMNNIMKTISAQLNDVQSQSLVINIIHYRMMVKQCLQHLVNSYVQQLVVFIRTVFRIQSKFQIKCVSQQFTQKKLKDIPNLKQVFNSKVGFSQAIKKDKHIFLKFSQSFAQSTSKAFMNKLTNKFILLGDLFMKKKGEFQLLLNKVAQAFPDIASQLVQAVLIVRDDIQNRAAFIPKKGMALGLSEY